MRNCPVCQSPKREFMWRTDFLVPDGWTKPPYLNWMRCECGMIYGDHPGVTQKDYDTFYKERYGYGVVDDDVRSRMAQRAEYIHQHLPYPMERIVDFGGGDSGLELYLRDLGYVDVTTYNIGDTMPQKVDCMIAEHVLEHVYDLEAAMQTITDALVDGGSLIVDVPDAGRMAFFPEPDMPMLDYTQVHINHFRTIDILNLCERFGFEMVETSIYTESLPCRMFVFRKGFDVACSSEQYIAVNMQEKAEKLRALGDTPVILWGCGDIAMHLLSRNMPNIQYFVDSDPAYRGATIKRLPVLERPNSDHPVIVLAQRQKQSILDCIEAEGIHNEVVVI